MEVGDPRMAEMEELEKKLKLKFVSTNLVLILELVLNWSQFGGKFNKKIPCNFEYQSSGLNFEMGNFPIFWGKNDSKKMVLVLQTNLGRCNRPK